MQVFAYIFDEKEFGIGVALGLSNLDDYAPDDPRLLKSKISKVWDKGWKVGQNKWPEKEAAHVNGIWTRIKNGEPEYRMLKDALAGKGSIGCYLTVKDNALEKISI